MSHFVASTILLASLCIGAFAQTEAPQSLSVRHFVAPAIRRPPGWPE